ncbi:MAG TPA: hypothetical protein VGM90_03355 [Kofleriaceae bacterium]|jgi:2,4-dienoyl-CoA reductase-like NADH-dependent reductase (Old Yellow Enzyme family)
MKKLFSGLRIGQLELAHRLVTTIDPRARLSADDYRRRATPGGLVIAARYADGAASPADWKRIVDSVHDVGSLAVALISPESKQQEPVVLDVDPVMDVYQRTARSARAAGFDGVELDAGAGALAERFLQAHTNARDDEYGGDTERRMRFLLEAVYVLAEEFSHERAGVRLSPCAREGQVELFADVMRALSERELAYVHLAHERTPVAPRVSGLSVSIAACADRQVFRTDVSCALIASDFVDVDVATSAVERRWADAVGFFQTDEDPEFVARILRQRDLTP